MKLREIDHFQELDEDKLRMEICSFRYVAVLRMLVLSFGRLLNAAVRGYPTDECHQIVDTVHSELKRVVGETLYEKMLDERLVMPVFDMMSLYLQGTATWGKYEDKKKALDLVANTLQVVLDETSRKIQEAGLETTDGLEKLVKKRVRSRRKSRVGKTFDERLELGSEVPLVTMLLSEDPRSFTDMNIDGGGHGARVFDLGRMVPKLA